MTPAKSFRIRISLAVAEAIRSGLRLQRGGTGVGGRPGSYFAEGNRVCPLGALRLREQIPEGYYVDESGRLVRDDAHVTDFLMGFDGGYSGKGTYFRLGRAWRKEALARGWL